MTSIVVGYIPKPEGRAALRRAMMEAKLRGSKLVIVHSERGTSDPDDGGSQPAGARLDEILEELAEAGVEAEVRPLSSEGDVAEDLVAVARELAAEIIVIGLRRRSPVGKLILGSNAQRILLDAPCPVLAVKAEDYADVEGKA